MQRNQFKNEIGTANKKKYEEFHKVSFDVPIVNTFSDCIKNTKYKVPNKRRIHVRNEKIDTMKFLI